MTKVPDSETDPLPTLRKVASDQPSISVRGLTKFYGRRLGVEDISFDVQPGQIMGFLGPNGSGKTTVMRMLMGLLEVTRGEGFVLGHDIADPSGRARREVGYLPGTLALYENLTVDTYLRLLADLRDIDCAAAIGALTERLQLPLTAPIKGLSKGNKQKVGVVQALMHDPKVLVLDEPTAGLDPIVQRTFEEIIHEQCDRGAAVLLSSHVMSEVEQLASDVVILDHGHLVLQDRLDRLKSRIERRIRFDFAERVDIAPFESCAGVVGVVADDRSIMCTVVGSEAPVLACASRAGVITAQTFEPTLDEIFLTATGGH